MNIESVHFVEGYTLHLKFQDGIEGDVDLSDLVSGGIFKVLQDKELFCKAYSNGYSLAWSDELEIDADNLYLDVTGEKMSRVNSKNPTHAPD